MAIVDEGRALFARARTVQVTTVSAAGVPMVRTVPAAGVAELGVAELGVADAVLSVTETIVSLDATTYFIEAHADALLEQVTCTAHLGQDRPLEERTRVIDQLWKRGAPGDVEALSLLLARFPELGTPSFLAPSTELHAKGVRLQCALDAAVLEEVLDLLQSTYWLCDLPRAQIRAAVIASTAVVAARDARGQLVAFARALSDGKCAWIYDVVVIPQLRGSHVGSAGMHVLLDHPAVRHARHVRLTTRDAMSFYRRLGFVDLAEAPRYAWTSTEMIRSLRS
jgi:ribosomal protein S18 acetylase RimI-like enzyme